MYDVVIIGSGIGGLTCGAFLARGGARVLVLEQHTQIGGYAHRFKRRSYEFDSGIHSVPMASGGAVDTILHELGIAGRIRTIDLPSMFTAHIADSSFTIPRDTQAAEEFFVSRFPDQRANLAKLFSDCRFFYSTVQKAGFDFEHGFVERNRDFVRQFHNRPFSDYLESVITEPQLRQMLYAMWPYAGIPAEKAATVFYLMMFAMHLLQGSQYCEGGFSVLADELAGVIRAQGGDVRVREKVTGIRVENDTVRAVVMSSGAEIEGRVFVSNICPQLLYDRLLTGDTTGSRWRRRCHNLNPSVSAVGVYLGLKRPVSDILPDCITFCYTHSDFVSIYANVMKGTQECEHVCILRPAAETGSPTAMLLTFANQRNSANWRTDKMIMAEKMLEQTEKVAPGFRERIDLIEVGSPDTFERYTANDGGALYGYENTSSLYGEARMPSRTNLTNLFQTGHWQRPGGGVWNVMVSGSAVSRTVLTALT